MDTTARSDPRAATYSAVPSTSRRRRSGSLPYAVASPTACAGHPSPGPPKSATYGCSSGSRSCRPSAVFVLWPAIESSPIEGLLRSPCPGAAPTLRADALVPVPPRPRRWRWRWRSRSPRRLEPRSSAPGLSKPSSPANCYGTTDNARARWSAPRRAPIARVLRTAAAARRLR
jgi:hypothetical protein